MSREKQKKIFIIFTIFLIILSIFSIIYLITLNNEINSLTNEKIKLESDIKNTDKKINDLETNITLLEDQKITQEHNPTFDEALYFINNDDTNNKTYYEGGYNCVYFSKDLNNNASEKGLKCAYVELIFNYGSSHAIIAFDTIDKGIVYFEPQTDQIVNISIGKDYWSECFENGIYKGPGNIISEINHYW